MQDPIWLAVFKIITLSSHWVVILHRVSSAAWTHRWLCLQWRQPSGCVWPSLQTYTDPSEAEQCGPGHSQHWWSQYSHCRVQPLSQSLVPAHGRKEAGQVNYCKEWRNIMGWTVLQSSPTCSTSGAETKHSSFHLFDLGKYSRRGNALLKISGKSEWLS